MQNLPVEAVRDMAQTSSLRRHQHTARDARRLTSVIAITSQLAAFLTVRGTAEQIATIPTRTC